MPRGASWRPAVACAVGGVLAALPFHSGALEPLAPLTLLPWLALVVRNPRLGFGTAWLGCIAFVTAGLWWLNHVHPVATLVCALHFGLYPAAGLWAMARLRAAGWPLVLAAPACVAAYEALLQRACLLETTWLSFGTLAWRATDLAQVASLGGTPLLSALVWALPAGFIDALPAWRSTRRLRAWTPLAGAAVAVAAAWGLGAALVPPQVPGDPLARVALVQGNVPQEIRSRPGQVEEIMRLHARLTMEGASPGLDLVAWPESTASLALEQDPEACAFLGQVAARVDAPLLLGAVGLNGSEPPSNSAFVITREGRIAGRSDKRYLVPGAETLLFLDHVPALREPLGNFLSRTMGFRPFLTRGKGSTVLQAGALKFGVLVCYDDLVASPAEGLRAAGAEALVTITNEAWFGRGELRQHLALCVFRCIETRLPMARSGNDGITCTIDPAGRVTAELPAWQEGVLVGELVASSLAPVPAWLRAAFQWSSVAAVAAGLVVARRRGRGREASREAAS